MKDRFLRRQRREGKGPERLELERSRETTEAEESQTTPFHLHGVWSSGFQLERMALGSSKLSLACRRYSPSWFRERMRDGERKTRRRRKKRRWWLECCMVAAVVGLVLSGGGKLEVRKSTWFLV